MFPARLMSSKTQMLCPVVDPTLLVNAGLPKSTAQPPEGLDRSPTAHTCLGNPQQTSSRAGCWQGEGKHQVWCPCSCDPAPLCGLTRCCFMAQKLLFHMDLDFHLYIGTPRGETALPFPDPKDCYQQTIKGRGADKWEEKTLKQGDFGSYVGQISPAGRGANQHMGFSGKSKDIVLIVSRRVQLWAQGSSPSLGFHSPVQHIKKCSLKTRRGSHLTNFITWGHVYSWVKCPQTQHSKLPDSSEMSCSLENGNLFHMMPSKSSLQGKLECSQSSPANCIFSIYFCIYSQIQH